MNLVKSIRSCNIDASIFVPAPSSRLIEIMSYYHLHSSPVPGLIFKDEEDYRTGINLLAICLAETDLTIYCFCLMSNHFHILLSGEKEAVVDYYEHYRKRLATYHARKYGGARHFQGMQMGLVEVTGIEHFKAEVSYILRNPYKAAIESPFSYRWSSHSLYFNPMLRYVRGMRVDSVSQRIIQKEIHSFQALPGHFEIMDGMILPKSFVDYQKVESFFETSQDFFNSVKDWKIEQEVESLHDKAEYQAYPDEVLMQKLQNDFRDHHVSGFHDMDARTSRQFISLMHRKYGCSKKQIHRITGFHPETIERFY